MSNMNVNITLNNVIDKNKNESELLTKDISSSYFCNSPSYKFEVIRDPKIRRGIPVIKGTRIGVYEVADMTKIEEIDDILDNYDTLNRDMIEKAVQYAEENPKI